MARAASGQSDTFTTRIAFPSCPTGPWQAAVGRFRWINGPIGKFAAAPAIGVQSRSIVGAALI
jgi:hypothetical protein